MCITLVVTLIKCTLFAHPKISRDMIQQQNMISCVHPTTNQRRSNEFRKESIYIPVRPCYNILMVDENGVVWTRTKGRDTQENFPESVIRICNISPGKRKNNR